MEVIQARSPYFITINENLQTSTRVELFIWHKEETEPVSPTYSLGKNASSPSQRKNVYNIAPFIKENIDIISPTLTAIIEKESNNNWCYCKVKTYSTVADAESLISTTTYIGLNGYTAYMGGYNQTNNEELQILVNTEIKRYYYPNIGYTDESYFNLLVQENKRIDYQITYFNNTGQVSSILIDNDEEDNFYKIPFIANANELINGGYVSVYNLTNSAEIYRVYSEPLCENKYTPMLCSFVNSFGGWGFITFFKAKSESYETKSKDFSLLPNDIDYNPLRGQVQKFNFESKKSVKVNTGWVDESYSKLLEDLFNSETVLLDNVPVKVKTSSFQLKTHLKDRVINYELDFEYNFNQINNVQ